MSLKILITFCQFVLIFGYIERECSKVECILFGIAVISCMKIKILSSYNLQWSTVKSAFKELIGTMTICSF